ncbi:S-adenosylmethionine:tRNA ribosyltransferase-isomerase [Pandoraea sputorum]|uniref:S-adenosylmethionine:tRNA ribosyltransferase-isomerase n=1 Tax=Pandoraea sputorum TaxID=93222 RepID=UPI001240C799|nr:S-adenosylmethionine:tRNA ribosyltransferase-isomerase [Pandoraea sputorum]VVE59522.1 S-adenosylmethionine tRNA ribosyltransferase [Pandoraea sputorum]
MKTKLFDFDVSSRVMPDAPLSLRGKSRDDGRLVVLDRAADHIAHSHFPAILDYLHAGDLLVFNDSYVLPNALLFRAGQQQVPIIVHGSEPGGVHVIDVQSALSLPPGALLACAHNPALLAQLLSRQADGLWRARLSSSELLMSALEHHGSRQEGTDNDGICTAPELWHGAPEHFRSVYARTPGSLDIPSAGLHFSLELLDRIRRKGVEIAYITLHVGVTETFAVRHISADEVENHAVKAEYFNVTPVAATQIGRALREQRRIIAVGTTVMRTLESLEVDPQHGTVRAQSGWTDLYIYPGFSFRLVGALLTNLHQPRSSHIVLTSAFAGTDLTLRSYHEILNIGSYEFDMYGDSMLIV